MGLIDTLKGLFNTTTADTVQGEVPGMPGLPLILPSPDETSPVASPTTQESPISFEEFMSTTDFGVSRDPSSSTGAVSLESKPLDSTYSRDIYFETTSGAPTSSGQRFENLSPLEDQILFHEGVRDKVYVDPGGNLAIGVGFNLDRGDAKEKIESLGLKYPDVRSGKARLNDNQIIWLFKQDVSQAVNDAKKFAGESWDNLSDVRKRVLTDMAYTLGFPRLSKFVSLKKALLKGDYKLAAQSMLGSKWFKQVKSRGSRLVRAMSENIINVG